MDNVDYEYLCNELELVNKENNFNNLSENVASERLNSLLNKHIVIDYNFDSGRTMIPAKLLKVNEHDIMVNMHDDGSEDIDCLEEIQIADVVGLEEYKPFNENLAFLDDYINKICRITNMNNVSIEMYIINYDGYEVSGLIKVENDNNYDVCVFYYPLYFLKEIVIKA